MSGLAWLEILQRPTPEAFASAFTQDAILEDSVLRDPTRGAAAIRTVFDATRGLYEQIAFLHEVRTGNRTYLEWEGGFNPDLPERFRLGLPLTPYRREAFW